MTQAPPITGKEFAKLQQDCVKSLHRLHLESQLALNLLTLVAQFPSHPEVRADLQSQLDEEDRARLDFQRRRRELMLLLPD